jgi:hypothetical protein
MNVNSISKMTLNGLFLGLIISQALHSLEEYFFQLWEVFEPARVVSGLVSSNLELGFVVVNASVVILGFLSYALPVSQNWTGARFIIGFWIVFESANAVGHLGVSLLRGDYIPGLGTAPLLLLFSALLARRLWRRQ